MKVRRISLQPSQYLPYWPHFKVMFDPFKHEILQTLWTKCGTLILKHVVTEKSLFVIWTIVGLRKFTAALQPVFLYQNHVTVFTMFLKMVAPLHIKSPYNQANMFSCGCFPYFQQLHKAVIQEVLSRHEDTRYTIHTFRRSLMVSSMYSILL
jgi:hypothetical protein